MELISWLIKVSLDIISWINPSNSDEYFCTFFWYLWLQKMSQCKQCFFHQLKFHKNVLDNSQYHNFMVITSKIILTFVQIFYHFFTINIHNQLLEKYIEEKNLKIWFNITPWFILIIDEYSWYHAWYVMWFFRYTGLRYIIVLDYMFIVKENNIMYQLICSVLRSASSTIMVNNPPIYLHGSFFFSMKWWERNV